LEDCVILGVGQREKDEGSGSNNQQVMGFQEFDWRSLLENGQTLFESVKMKELFICGLYALGVYIK